MPASASVRRVALISEHASPLRAPGGVDSGGQNVYVEQVARRLAAAGHHVDVYTRRDDPALPEVVACDGYRVFHVDAGPATAIPKEQLLPWMDDFARYVIQQSERQRYDLLHANFWMSALVAAEVKAALGIPFVVTFHALGRVRRQHQGEQDGFPDDRFDIEDRAVREAARIIAECPQDEIDLCTLYGAEPSRITIIPSGFDPAECHPVDRRLARSRLGLPLDAEVVLQLGRLVPRKGIEETIRGFAAYQREGHPDALLLVVGGEDDSAVDPFVTPEINRLQLIAEEEGVADSCRFPGRCGRNELKYYYSAADVFVTTPWYEPFGITPVEAMACGTPVIGARVGGIQYTVKDGETGILVPPRDPDVIAEALDDLLSDPAKRARFAEQGIRRANGLFTWDIVAEAISALYEDVLTEEAIGTVPFPGVATSPVSDGIEALISLLARFRDRHESEVLAMGRRISETFARGGKLLVCGNGGSAAEAQHLVAEFVGRFLSDERRGLPAIALTSDSVTVTAWANDVGFDEVFARQVQALSTRGDALLVLSTSGRSPNVVRALEAARSLDVQTLALLGHDGGPAASLADQSIVVPSSDTQRVQEVHGLVVHLLAEVVEADVLHRDHLANVSELPRPNRAMAMGFGS